MPEEGKNPARWHWQERGGGGAGGPEVLAETIGEMILLPRAIKLGHTMTLGRTSR